MQFEWDEQKRVTNIRKHGIDFRDARQLFDAPMLVAIDERADYDADRWIGIGTLNGRVVVTSYLLNVVRILFVSSPL